MSKEKGSAGSQRSWRAGPAQKIASQDSYLLYFFCFLVVFQSNVSVLIVVFYDELANKSTTPPVKQKSIHFINIITKEHPHEQ